jgi:hypothetical protein
MRLALLSAASLIAPGFELAREWRQGDQDTMVITGASVALFLLVILRISGLVRQQERAAVREHVLQSAGAALVAATSTREIYDAALSALPQLLGPGAEARLCVPDGEDLALLGCDADAPLQALSADAGQVLGAAAWGGSVASLPQEVRLELSLPDPYARGLVLPLAVRGECLGLLVVGSESPLSPLLITAISSLATKVSLALESDALSGEVHRRESEARFASLVRHATDLITVVGADGVVTYQSPSSESCCSNALRSLTSRPLSTMPLTCSSPSRSVATISKSTRWPSQWRRRHSMSWSVRPGSSSRPRRRSRSAGEHRSTNAAPTTSSGA